MPSRAHALAARRRLALDEATDVRADAGCVEDALGRRVGEALIPIAGGGATRASTLTHLLCKVLRRARRLARIEQVVVAAVRLEERMDARAVARDAGRRRPRGSATRRRLMRRWCRGRLLGQQRLSCGSATTCPRKSRGARPRSGASSRDAKTWRGRGCACGDAHVAREAGYRETSSRPPVTLQAPSRRARVKLAQRAPCPPCLLWTSRRSRPHYNTPTRAGPRQPNGAPRPG